MELINNYQLPEGYKKTEVGVIPEDWDVVIFDECFDILSGYGFKKSEYTNYGVKLLRIDNVSYGRVRWDSIAFLPIKYTETYKNLLINEGDFLLALNRPITNDKLKIAIAKNSDIPSILYQRVGKIIRLSEIYDKDCAFHILYKFIKQFVEESAVGTDQPFISTTNLKKCKLPIPPKEEQKAIAQTLSDVDALIDELDKLIAKKRNIKTGTMQQLLTGKTRLLGFGGEWEIKKIEDIARPVSVKNVENEKLPVLTCSKHLGFVDSLAYFKNQIFSKNTTGYKVICFGEIGYPSNHIEEGSIGIQDLYDKALVSPIYTIFSVNQEIDSHFLHKVLKLDYYRQKFKTLTTSSVDRRGSLRWPEFSQITVSLPPLPEQKAIAKVLSDIDTEITALEKRRAKTQAIKQGMMQELLTGRTRLKIEHPDDPITKNSNG